MGIRVRKSIKIAPGVRMNVGKRGVSASFGGHGVTYTVGGKTGHKRKVSSSRTKYNSANARLKQLEREREKADKERRKQLELETAQLAVEEYEAKIEEIQSMHKLSIEPIDWDEKYSIKAPYLLGEMGPCESVVRQKINNYKPGVSAKFLKLFNPVENGKFEKMLNEAIEQDKQDYENWKYLNEVAKGVLDQNVDIMLEFLSQSGVFDDFTDFGSGFNVSFLDAKHVEVEFDVMPDEVVPKDTLSLTSTGKLSQKIMPVTKRYEIVQDYVCSGVLRIARDMMAIFPIEEIVIHAMDTVLNTQIGKYEKVDVLSVKIPREKLLSLNFDMIDPSDSMVNFECNMKFLKTKGFQPIQRL